MSCFSPVTDLKMRSQKRSPFSELKVVSHQEIEKSRGFVPRGGHLGSAALEDLVAEGSTHVHPSLEKRWGELHKRHANVRKDTWEILSHAALCWQNQHLHNTAGKGSCVASSVPVLEKLFKETKNLHQRYLHILYTETPSMQISLGKLLGSSLPYVCSVIPPGASCQHSRF